MVCLPKAFLLDIVVLPVELILTGGGGSLTCSDGRWGGVPDRIFIFSDSFEETPWSACLRPFY